MVSFSGGFILPSISKRKFLPALEIECLPCPISLAGKSINRPMTVLRHLAESDGVSMEEKVRRILRESVAIASKPGDLAVELFRPACADEAFRLPEREVDSPPSLLLR